MNLSNENPTITISWVTPDYSGVYTDHPPFVVPGTLYPTAVDISPANFIPVVTIDHPSGEIYIYPLFPGSVIGLHNALSDYHQFLQLSDQNEPK